MKKIENVSFAYDASIMFECDEKFLFGREPTLRRMSDGTLTSLIYTGGKREPDPQNVVAQIKSRDDGATWSKPEVIFSHPCRCCWGTELFTGGDLPMAIFQTFDFCSYYCELRCFYSCSEDNGKSWSSPKSIPGVPPNFSCRQGKVLSDGSWIFPVYWVEVRDHWQFRDPPDKFPALDRGWNFVAGVIRSEDRGQSFSLHGFIRCGEKTMPGNRKWSNWKTDTCGCSFAVKRRNVCSGNPTASISGAPGLRRGAAVSPIPAQRW